MKTHIIFGDSPGALIQHALKKENDHFIVFDDILSVGPIMDLNSDEGINHRYDWLKRNHMIESNPVEKCRSFKEVISQLRQLENQEVVVWYAENAAEQTGLYFVMHYLINKNVQLINISEKIKQQKPNHLHIRSSGEVNMEQVQEIYHLTRDNLSLEQKKELINLFDELKESCLRVRGTKGVKTAAIDYFDEEILETVQRLTMDNDDVLMIRVVGEMMGLMSDYVGDSFIIGRIFELIKENQLEVSSSSEIYHGSQIVGRKIKLKD